MFQAEETEYAKAQRSRGYILVGGTWDDVGKLSIEEEVRCSKGWDSRGCWETRLCARQALVVLHFILGATGIHQRALIRSRFYLN